MSRLRHAVGAVVVASALAVAGTQLARVVRDWSTMGPLPPGGTLVDFAVERLEGGTFSAADLQGKITVVTFWATWCGVCVGELADLSQMQADYAQSEVQFLAVNFEGRPVSRDVARTLVERYRAFRGIELPFAIDDGTAAHRFRVGPIPHTLVFDRAGVLRHVHQGRVLASTLHAEIDALRG